MQANYQRSRALPGSIKRSKGGPPYIYNGSERGKRMVSCPRTAQRERAAAGAGGRAALQELAGQASLWPRLICRLFWMRRLRNADRAVLCTFCFVNGVPPSLVLDWSGGCVPIFGDESAQHHFAYVHEALSVGR